MAPRIKWLDIAKGIGIVSVFYGHCTQSLCNELYLYIYTFHMPLFFFISGLCFNKLKYSDRNNARNFICKRTNQLLIPLVASMLLFCLLNSLFGLGTYSFEKLCGISFPPAMWFVFSLLVIEMLYFVINIFFGGSFILDILLAIVSLAFAIVIARYSILLPANLSSVPLGMFFFVVGIQLRKIVPEYRNLLLKSNLKYVISLALLTIPVVYVHFVKDHIDVVDGVIPEPFILALFIAFVGIAAIFTISMLMEKICSQRIQDFVCYLGRNTLTILMFHLFVIKVSSDYLRPLLGGMGTEPITAWIWILIIVVIVNKYLPFLAGKGSIIGRRNDRP